VLDRRPQRPAKLADDGAVGDLALDDLDAARVLVDDLDRVTVAPLGVGAHPGRCHRRHRVIGEEVE
jgi:hypothetical protein